MRSPELMVKVVGCVVYSWVTRTSRGGVWIIKPGWSRGGGV